MNKNQIFAVSLVGALVIPFVVLIVTPALIIRIYEIELNFYFYVAPGLTPIISIWMFSIIKRRLNQNYRKRIDS